jgi:FK506-binding nuclear protein
MKKKSVSPTKAQASTWASKNSADGNQKKEKRIVNDEIAVTDSQPKSKKELRLERKAAKRKAAEEKTTPAPTLDENTWLDEEEYQKLKKQRRAEQRKEQERIIKKELEEAKKLRKRKKMNRELNAKGGVNTNKQKKQKTTSQSDKAKAEAKAERDANMDAFRSVFHGSSGKKSSETGMTTTRLGVQFEDKVVGTGKLLKEGVPITVKYVLTGGKFGAEIDSSKKFTFRPGLGEVIRGWDIGLEGMREGGRRKLIVPPKAGYGGKDIGAGPGALLYFDVTLLQCGSR